MAISRGISGPSLSRNVPATRLNLEGQIYEDADDDDAAAAAANGSSFSEDCDATLRFITQMLMDEEDLVNKPCMFTDILALQATEKSFYKALVSSHEDNTSSDSGSASTVTNQSKPSDLVLDEKNLHDYVLQTVFRNFSSANTISPARDDDSPTGSWNRRRRRRKSHEVDDDDDDDGNDSEIAGPSNKQLAMYLDESDDELQEAYDKALLCPILNPHLHQNCDKTVQICRSGIKSLNRSKSRGKKTGGKGETVDLSTLLVNCAQSAASFDLRNAYEILKQIRNHSSPYGNGTQRMAHFFANALEARLAGTGTTSYAAFIRKRISAADVLRGYQLYVTASPFNKASNSYANKSIMKLVGNADSLHIIDFGILYGFQWPCLIQNLSFRPGGPPKIHITGIDFPQPGLRPAERIEETGRRLATYCKRFKVPFKFTSIAKKWDEIEAGDLLHVKKKPGELLIVNSMNRLRNLLDETVILDSPRDALLKVIRKLNPDLFIHGEMIGMYSAPFFVTRFREAIFHFSSWFDMFDTVVVGRENRGRMLFEEEIMGRDIMNVVACEGFERIERPETYKQWQVRIHRAGFRQQDLNWDVVEETAANVKRNYHKEFTVDTDGKWMIQGWKGRIIYCVSCWKPAEEEDAHQQLRYN
ncbi:scarecrow-like protein 11 [Impatiens glandulifera]|uniref:scarecrow-like protein 11 n=1 Tax=Impatiens glandulifera TaxID=253017 RepID=UPI001FB13497|nr:scarecrow-like protein 11 [Impatiens glandulifera]